MNTLKATKKKVQAGSHGPVINKPISKKSL